MAPDCIHCGEPVTEQDRRFTYANGPVVHAECDLRAIAGSVGHQLGRCSCFGGDEEDPPGMTKREAARAAAALFVHMQTGD
jgi:hypothetical protein